MDFPRTDTSFVQWTLARLAPHFRRTAFDHEVAAAVMGCVRAALCSGPDWDVRCAGRKGDARLMDTVRTVVSAVVEGDDPHHMAALVAEALVLLAHRARVRLDAPLWLVRWLEGMVGEGPILVANPTSGMLPEVWSREGDPLVVHPAEGLGEALLGGAGDRPPRIGRIASSPLASEGVWKRARSVVAVFGSSSVPWNRDGFGPGAVPVPVPSEKAGVSVALLMAGRVAQQGGSAVVVAPNGALFQAGGEGVARREVLQSGVIRALYSLPNPWEAAEWMWLGAEPPRYSFTAVVMGPPSERMVAGRLALSGDAPLVIARSAPNDFPLDRDAVIAAGSVLAAEFHLPPVHDAAPVTKRALFGSIRATDRALADLEGWER